MIVCRGADIRSFEAAQQLNDEETATCTKIERDFLRELLGGCSTPISALAIPVNGEIRFMGNILSVDGKQKVEIDRSVQKAEVVEFGKKMAVELLKNGGEEVARTIRNAK